MTARRRFLPLLPGLTVLVLIGPMLAGLTGTILPALGYLPAAGLTDIGLGPFRSLMSHPGILASIWLSVVPGIVATVLALSLTMLIVAGWYGTRAFRRLQLLLSPLLSVPHAAAAFGLAFLISPSGWVARLISPWATGWDRPPDLLIVQDPWGAALILGLVIKEVPFLLLMTLAALGQVDPAQSIRVSVSLGYGRIAGWMLGVLPRVYAQIRLPVYVVLGFSMSVVDVAIILGPTTPAPLSVQVVRWMSDPDITLRLQAAAGALLQFGLVIGALILWRLGEVSATFLGRYMIERGLRLPAVEWLTRVGLVLGGLSAATLLLGIGVLAIWSFAGFWGFPDALPDSLTLDNWMRHGMGLADAARQTAGIALASAGIALVLTIGCLEAEARHGLRMSGRALWLLYLPLLVPQVAFLPGLQTLMIWVGLDAGAVPVTVAHVVFVLPYVFLSLAGPFRAWDTRFGTIGAALGASPDRVLWAIRLPMLLRPVLIALAVGLSVSVGQYLATLLIGGGRVQTLTTEALALSAGGDRRAIGLYALVQTAAALLPFWVATLLPEAVWRNRKGLRHD